MRHGGDVGDHVGGRTRDAHVARGRAGAISGYDEVVLLRERCAHIDVAGGVLVVGVDGAAAVAIGRVATDAPVGGTDTDRPAGRSDGDASRPCPVGARVDDAGIGDVAI